MAEPTKNSTVNNEEATFLDYILMLAKHSRMIIYTSMAVTVLTYVILLILPNTYKASARLLPPQQKLTLSAQLLNSLGGAGTPGVSLLGPMGGGMGASLLGLKSPSDLYAGMMAGNTIFDRIIEHFKLRQVYKAKYIEDARLALIRRVNIGVDKKAGVITIEVTDKDPKRAADIANAFPEELEKLLQRLTFQEASGRLAFLERERSQVNQHLAIAENALRCFSEKNSVIQIDAQTRSVLEYIARLRAEVDAKEVQIQVMRQQATSNNYDVVRAETEVKGLKNKLKTAESQHDQVSVGDICLTGSKIPSLGLEYLQLYREVKFQEGLYQFYLKMVELARLDMVKDVPSVQLIDRAIPPEKRSNKRLPTTLMAGIMTFVLLSFVALIRESLGKVDGSEGDSLRRKQILGYMQLWRQDVQRLRFWRKQ